MGLKKFILVLILCLISFFSGCSLNQNKVEYDYNIINDIVIRFHVIANSDSDEDQKLKLKVRDVVINYLYPYMKDVKNLDESRKIIKEKNDEVIKLVNKVIKQNGYNYSVESRLSRENFPEKEYGNIIFPQGNYEAYRIIIGNGEGHNWWCVMFPPLCFADETKENVKSEQNTEKLNEYIEEEVKVKFKVVEWIKGLFS
ncbi:MAG: stage II sporulation protein R [Clostridium sp.]|nr:stage II sporulation protein R [Clostridium sp.]MDY3828188.1 stage II sporulation protein R [Clostridium sp.]